MEKLVLSIKLFVLGVCLAGTALAAPRETIRSQAEKEGKGTLVYAYGSDWSRAGRAVLKSFRSPAFTNAVGSAYVLGEVRAAEQMTDAIKQANAWCAPGDLDSLRLPALFACDRAGHGFLALENIPIDTTPADLLKQLRAAEKNRDAAEALVRESQSLKGTAAAEKNRDAAEALVREGQSLKGTAAAEKNRDAAEALVRESRSLKGTAAAEKIGAALALYARALGDDKRLLSSKCQAALFDRLKKLDPSDQTGWQARFTLGNAIRLISDANAIRVKKSSTSPDAYLKQLRARNTRHLTTNQRQALLLAEFALDRENAKRKPEFIRLLDRIAAMDPTTLWGECATGWLIRWNAPEAKRHLVPKKPLPSLRSRGTARKFIDLGYDRCLARDCERLAGVTPSELANLDQPRRTSLVRAYIMLSAGKAGIDAIAQREGGREFLLKFLADRAWMEAFAGSGPWHHGGATALSALDALVWNEPAIYTNTFARTAATAFALTFPDDTNTLRRTVRALKNFEHLSERGRLHDSVYNLNVYEWRYLWFDWDQTDPDELLWFNDFACTTSRRLWSHSWCVPYRLKNCFGESVFGKGYYQPWAHRHSRYTVAPDIGGVCNMISSFGTTLGHANGLMAVTAGQPRHCAFLVRPTRGAPKPWEIHYSIWPFTQGRWKVYNMKGGGYHAILAAEQLYTTTRRIVRDAPRWLARVRNHEKKTSEATAALRSAMRGAPGNWPAGCDWRNLLNETHADNAAWETYFSTVLETMSTQVVMAVDLALPQIDRQLAANDVAGAGASSERLLKSLRETDWPVREPANFSDVLTALQRRWWKRDLPRLFNLFKLALETERGTPNYFMQTVQWGASRFMGTANETNFIAALEAAMPREGDVAAKKKDIQPWRKLLMNAESRDNPANYAAMRQLVNRIFPPAPFPKGTSAFPLADFDGSLVTTNALVRSSGLYRLTPAERHCELFDASPLRPGGRHPEPVRLNDKKAPCWLGLRLGGETEISGLRICAPKGQPAGTIEISSDGKAWTPIGQLPAGATDFRLDRTTNRARARFVRVVRAGGREGGLALLKLLVYGRKLY